MATTGKLPLSLYFHIPFCTKKCPYCHFFVIRDNESQKNQLLECFFKELLLLKIPSHFDLISIYFGGGTPSLFGPERIEALISFINQNILPIKKECEVTLEANPENVTLERFQAYKEAGITRVSLGVQSLHDPSLVTIGRTHNSNRSIEAIWQVYQAGITNISIDLMYDRPHQTLQDWEKELEMIKDLPMTHLSLYNMTIEEGSAYKRHEATIKKKMPSDTLSLKLHQKALEKLEELGFERYEISAFCKNGKRSLHNLGYWQGRDFYGLGPSAFSYFDKKRFKNVSNFKFYVDAVSSGQFAYDFEEKLKDDDALKEMLCIGLRVKEGVNLKEFEKKFGQLSLELLKNIETLICKGLLVQERGYLKLTEQGMLFYDDVGSYLI
jgi:oxygen-independent coproporphyrinogen III oxidase